MSVTRLTERSLGGRQRQINEAVKATESWNPEENTVPTNLSDTDILYKIDVASKFKDLNFMVEILKSGDSLYISKVIRHTWIYNIKYKDIIEPNHLYKNVFPFMSKKMKSKFLNTAAVNIREESRIIAFSEFCFQRIHPYFGYKFLIYTPEDYKVVFINNDKLHCDEEIAIKVIGNSLKLAELCIQKDIIKPLKVPKLYFLSPSEYLDLFEKYQPHHGCEKFSVGVTKHILKNVKDRVVNKPIFYLLYLNSKVAFKHLKAEDTVNLGNDLPKNADKFWNILTSDTIVKFCNLIPAERRYSFLKECFMKKYPEEEFETSRVFYNYAFYDYMTKDEKNKWAKDQIEKGDGFFGDKDDYTWYEYVNFDYAFDAMRKIIAKTTDHVTRMSHLLLLVNTTSTHEELAKLLKYFCSRHINEVLRKRFVEKVLNKYDLFTLKGDCWESLNNILHSIGIYSSDQSHDVLKIQVMVYHIINDIEVPQCLTDFFVNYLQFYYLIQYLKKIPDHKEKVHDYVTNIFVNEVRKREENISEGNFKKSMINILDKAIEFFSRIEIKFENYPNIISKHIKNYPELLKRVTPTEQKSAYKMEDPIRLIKKDVTLVNEKISLIVDKLTTREDRVRYNRILRKVNIYFHGETSDFWVTYFKSLLDGFNESDKVIQSAVYGIFALGSSEDKLNMIEKYKPLKSKIEYGKIDSKTVAIQENICKMLACPRKHLPLKKIMLFVKGDYLKFCMPSLNSLGATLPTGECIKLVDSLINSPVSVQKHGIRLAFKCLGVEGLTKFVLNSWRKTKNVSLRKTLFVSMYTYTQSVTDVQVQREITQILQKLMASLTNDDDEEIYSCLSGNSIPDEMRGEYLECAYRVVEKLHNNKDRKLEILSSIRLNLSFMNDDFVYDILSSNTDVSVTNAIEKDLIEELQNLASCFIIHSTADSAIDKRVALLKLILASVSLNWDLCINQNYVSRIFLDCFMERLLYEAIYKFISDPSIIKSTVYLKLISDTLSKLPTTQVYLFTWMVELIMVVQDNVQDCSQLFSCKEDRHPENEEEAERYFFMIGKGFADTIVKLKKSGPYFTTMTDYTVELYEKVFKQIYTLICAWGTDFGEDLCKANLCLGIMYIDNLDCFSVALKLLPCDFDKIPLNTYETIVAKTESIQSSEVQTLAYHKLHPNHRNLSK